MIARTIVIMSLIMLCYTASGCKPPEAKSFVDGKRTAELHPEAAKEVRQIVDAHFGTPHNLVATLELPVNFGRIAGTVLDTPKTVELKKHQFYVSLEGGPFTKDDLKDLGVVWKTGDYQQSVYTVEKNDAKAGLKKGDEADASFYVLNLEPSEEGSKIGILSVNYLLAEPVKPGDTFDIVGQQLRNGRKLYMQHCMHCHGYSGDGNGPTAKYLNPLPRDYRLGIFKFTSTLRPDRVSRDDLMRILHNGIPGTYMPSFRLQPEQELRAIIEYVRWLSIRGEFEHRLASSFEFSKDEWEDLKSQAPQKHERALERWNKRPGKKPEPQEEDFLPSNLLKVFVEEDLSDEKKSKLDFVQKNWLLVEAEETAAKHTVRPLVKRTPSSVESIARGRALYLSASKTNCFSCHGKTGRGDGPQTTSYQKNQILNKEYPEPGLYDDWNNKIKPRDLTRGIYRGGRRPIDLYRRVKVGIKGTPMPPFGTLSDEQIWDLVNYILSIPIQQN